MIGKSDASGPGIGTLDNRYVTQGTTQNITATKTFTTTQRLQDNVKLYFDTAQTMDIQSDGANMIVNTPSSGNRLILTIPGAVGSVASSFVMYNTDTGFSGAGMLVSAGSSATSFIGGLASKRTDASTNSLTALRVFSNSALTAADTTSPFFLQGATTGVTTHINSGIVTVIVAKTGTYSATLADHVITGDATSAAFTITIPTASGNAGLEYIVKKIDSSANAVTIATSAGNIDASATYVLSSQYKYVKVVSNGTNWLIIGNN